MQRQETTRYSDDLGDGCTIIVEEKKRDSTKRRHSSGPDGPRTPSATGDVHAGGKRAKTGGSDDRGSTNVNTNVDSQSVDVPMLQWFADVG